MPSIHLPYVNIALDLFALVITLIVLASCYKEFSSRTAKTKYFLFELIAICVALVANIISWLGEGHPNLELLTVISNTVASCTAQIVVICFMGYLKENLYESNRVASLIVKLFAVLGTFAVLFSIGNAFFGYAFRVNADGHWHHTEDVYMSLIYLLFPILSFFTVLLMAVFARSSTKVNRAAFVIYTLFPVAGIIVDYAVHGLSLTYAGLSISVLVMYTSIYLKKQKVIEEQRNALMISQINPHFVYNTLSTIASMCDVSPQQAKYLTIDFSRYLRKNLSSLNSESTIPFEEELSHVECYLKIEKARFRERLNIVYSIGCRDFSIPPLTVQPLVENAVKHGVTKKADGGTVKICTYDTNISYVIEIIDDGVGFDTDNAQMHVGLENVRSRIMAMCKGDVTVKSTIGVGTRVTVEIPKRKGKRK
jgi:signal transduction histidine kinase